MSPPSLPPGHVAALAAVARLLADAGHDWWIIAGAAVALHGAHLVHVDDIDVLIDVGDVALVARIPGVRLLDRGGNGRFQSDFHAVLDVGGVTVEWMAGFTVNIDGRWRTISPRTRQTIHVADTTVFVPDRAEMIAMLRMFDRPKDHARITLLDE